jgi:hypothetical protein
MMTGPEGTIATYVRVGAAVTAGDPEQWQHVCMTHEAALAEATAK